MLNPFRLFVKMLIAAYRIVGYALACCVQVAIYLSTGRKDKVGDALGYLGRGATDAMADIFRS